MDCYETEIFLFLFLQLSRRDFWNSKFGIQNPKKSMAVAADALSPSLLFLSTLITTPPHLTHHHHKPSCLLLIPRSSSSAITNTTPTPTTKDSRIEGTMIRWGCDVNSLENAETLRRWLLDRGFEGG
ncbi:hypothetical protein Droror1_Dr00006494 [Drosera rotundifolia]